MVALHSFQLTSGSSRKVAILLFHPTLRNLLLSRRCITPVTSVSRGSACAAGTARSCSSTPVNMPEDFDSRSSLTDEVTESLGPTLMSPLLEPVRSLRPALSSAMAVISCFPWHLVKCSARLPLWMSHTFTTLPSSPLATCTGKATKLLDHSDSR